MPTGSEGTSPFTTLSITLLSGAISGLLVAYSNYRLQRSKEEFNLLRTKGEIALNKIKEMAHTFQMIHQQAIIYVNSHAKETRTSEKFEEKYGPEGIYAEKAFMIFY